MNAEVVSPTIDDLSLEIAELKKRLETLEAAVERMSSTLASARLPPNAPQRIKWVDMIGLGKEIWEGIDVDAYINAERDSWE